MLINLPDGPCLARTKGICILPRFGRQTATQTPGGLRKENKDAEPLSDSEPEFCSVAFPGPGGSSCYACVSGTRSIEAVGGQCLVRYGPTAHEKRSVFIVGCKRCNPLRRNYDDSMDWNGSSHLRIYAEFDLDLLLLGIWSGLLSV